MVQFPECWLIILKPDPRLAECQLLAALHASTAPFSCGWPTGLRSPWRLLCPGRPAQLESPSEHGSSFCCQPWTWLRLSANLAQQPAVCRSFYGAWASLALCGPTSAG